MRRTTCAKGSTTFVVKRISEFLQISSEFIQEQQVGVSRQVLFPSRKKGYLKLLPNYICLLFWVHKGVLSEIRFGLTDASHNNDKVVKVSVR